MNQTENLPDQQDDVASNVDDNEIDLLGLIQTLGEEKWLLFGLPFICACAAVVVSLYLTPIYIAKATYILPDKQSSSVSATLDQLGGLGGLAGGLSKSPAEMYVAILQSNIVKYEIVDGLDLLQYYQSKTQEDASNTLSSRIKITIDKRAGLLTIEAQDKSPDIAAKLANAHLIPFRAFLNRMSLEEARLRRDFFARQIEVISQRPFRDPFAQSTLMNSMIKQYEVARIDGASESQILFPLDMAKSPEKRSSPKRVQFVVTVGLIAFFLTLSWIFIKRALQHAKDDPATSQKWAKMKKAWKLWR
jgi:uncharacterized protein involved in exopolysaccharide biosynthesis